MHVQVLMSTYNGEKYLKEQILSILAQKGVEISLLIRDDGSTDSTKEKIIEFAQQEPRIQYMFEQNIGVKKSFLRLIQEADKRADYLALSDQDDIWLPEKMSVAISALEEKSSGYPLIYGSSVFIYKGGQIIGEQFICEDLHLGNFLIKNYFPGCTMVFNQKLRELIDMIDIYNLERFPLHDHWLNLVCTACHGEVITSKSSQILYRQHDNNTIGDRGFIEKIRDHGLFGHSNNTRLKIATELMEKYTDELDENSFKLLDCVVHYKKRMKNRIKLAFNSGIKAQSFPENLTIWLIVMLGKF